MGPKPKNMEGTENFGSDEQPSKSDSVDEKWWEEALKSEAERAARGDEEEPKNLITVEELRKKKSTGTAS